MDGQKAHHTARKHAIGEGPSALSETKAILPHSEN